MISIRTDGRPVFIEHGQVFIAKSITREESHRYIDVYWNGYDALLTDIIDGDVLVECHDGLNCTAVNDALRQLDPDSREMICLYYGLMSRKKHNTYSDVAWAYHSNTGVTCVGGTGVFPDWEVKRIIDKAVETIGRDAGVRRLIALLTQKEHFANKEEL